MTRADSRRFRLQHVIGQGIQVGAVIAGVNAARDTDWPVIVIMLGMAVLLGLGEGIKEL